MRFVAVLFLSMVLAAGDLTIQASQETDSKAPKYRLVHSSLPKSGDSLRNFDYAVSVDHWLDLQSIRNVVCHVVDVEKPTNYRSLMIEIYFNLDEYPEWIADGGGDFIDPGQQKLAEHSISYYAWHVDLPDKKNRLLIARDAGGVRLASPGSDDFDHTRDCGKQ